MNKKGGFNFIISACLLGIPCRWNKKGKAAKEAINIFLKGKSIAICPEIIAGFPTPRKPCEIVGGDGHDVIIGKARVLDEHGYDQSKQYIKGAKIVLKMVNDLGIKKAILKSGSPSCGVDKIYSGKFNGMKKKGKGILTALLNESGIKDVREI